MLDDAAGRQAILWTVLRTFRSGSGVFPWQPFAGPV